MRNVWDSNTKCLFENELWVVLGVSEAWPSAGRGMRWHALRAAWRPGNTYSRWCSRVLSKALLMRLPSASHALGIVSPE